LRLPGKDEVLLGGEVLVAEKDDAVFAKGVSDIRQGRLGEGCRQIDPADFRAECG
jgi:hypothetical protein